MTAQIIDLTTARADRTYRAELARLTAEAREFEAWAMAMPAGPNRDAVLRTARNAAGIELQARTAADAAH